MYFYNVNINLKYTVCSTWIYIQDIISTHSQNAQKIWKMLVAACYHCHQHFRLVIIASFEFILNW